MLWFYTRDRQSLTLETRYDNATNEYVGIISGFAGPSITKRFSTQESFREWLAALERDLEEDDWRRDGEPRILPDGWRDKPHLRWSR